MSNKGFTTITITGAVALSTLISIWVPLPYKAGITTQKIQTVESDVSEIKTEVSHMKENQTKLSSEISEVKEGVAFIRGYIENKGE